MSASAAPSLLPSGFGNGVRAEVAGSVSAVSVALGTFVADALTLSASSSTIFRDENSSGGAVPDAHFDLGKPNVGDYVQAIGLYDASAMSSFSAYKVERLPPSGAAQLRGTVSSMSASSLTLLGLPVDLSAATLQVDD
jgi:hypothetical protein